jgi:cation-transporting ATPase E
MLAAMALVRRKVLVQQMPAVETLARVDTLLLDKTGTITEGNIQFEAVIINEKIRQKKEYPDEKIKQVLATIASRAKSPTNNALAEELKKIKPAKFTSEIPFSSARKWSAIEIDERAWVFGASEVLLGDKPKDQVFQQAQKIASEGKRVLVLIEAKKMPAITDKKLPASTSVALVVLSEKIRDDAAQTLEYFAEQQVDIKIISGDSPLTVAAVARAVNFKEVKVFDARDLPDPTKSEKTSKKFAEIIAKNNVFGRVQPEQKRQITAALQLQGHVVAVTGDGVNDALALKKADLGIAMNSGSAATKSVAEIVLLDNKFSHLPNVLAEGRRVIANIERVSNLFIIKNVYTLVLALMVTIAGLTYPYLPGQMTLISALSIGIPAFFLALAPNRQLYQAGFLKRVLKFAVPIGATMAILMMVDYLIAKNQGAVQSVAGTSVSILVMAMMATVMVILSRPVKGWKLGLILFCLVAFAICITVPFFAEKFRYDFDLSILPMTFIMSVIGVSLVYLVHRVIPKHN